MAWAVLLGLSALAGGVCGWWLADERAVRWGAAVPWLGLLTWLLLSEYVLPYRGGGASMWPIAQVVGGTAAAAAGGAAAAIMRAVRGWRRA